LQEKIPLKKRRREKARWLWDKVMSLQGNHKNRSGNGKKGEKKNEKKEGMPVMVTGEKLISKPKGAANLS